MSSWYPQKKEELNEVLEEYLSQETKTKSKEVHGLVVPHAGYEFSGEIVGKAFSLLKDKKISKAIVLGPSHKWGFNGIAKLPNVKTPLGKVKILKAEIIEIHGLDYEHSVDNQIPFLQKLNPDIEILPLVVGEITEKDAKAIAKDLSKENTIFVFSTDLSHFLSYEKAVKKDKETIKLIENLDFKNIEKLDVCGKNPLMIMMHLCKLNNWKPKLIEYKNSGDITSDKSSVVGYAGLWF